MTREITKEQYDRAMEHGGFIASDDKGDVFTMNELIGYGVYSDRVFTKDGKYFVDYVIGSSCD